MSTMIAARARRDTTAFLAVSAFVVVMYAVPSEWIPLLAPLRLALVTSALAGLLILLAPRQLQLDVPRGGALVALGALAVASRAWAVNPDVSSGTGWELVKMAACYFMVINVVTSWERVRRLALVIVLASAVTSIGVIHWYFRGIDLVEGYRARWVGVYADPNHMAMALVLVAPLAMGFVVRKGGGWAWRAAAGLAGALSVLAIVYSHSRGGFLGLSTALLIWAMGERRRLRSIAMGGAVAVLLLFFAPSSFWQRNETVADLSGDASAQGRVYAWEVAHRISIEHPVAGVGAGGFRFAWALYAPPEARRAYVAHNVFLDVLGELGAMGLMLFLITVGGALAGAFASGADPAHGWLGRSIAAALGGYLVCQLFSGYLLSSHLFLLLGLGAAAGNLVERAARWIPVAEPTP